MKTKYVALAALAVTLPSFSSAMTDPKTVAIYNWTDYIGKTTLADFQSSTGIKPIYDVFDSNEVLEAKLLTGHSGYSVVFPSNHFVERQIKAGVFMKLDKSLLPNYSNLDPEILKKVDTNDPGNLYAVPYMWGTKGIAYNKEMVKKALGVDHLDSWAAVFDPDTMKKLSTCGVAFMDSPDEIFNIVLTYQGKDPNSTVIEDYEGALDQLKKVKPYVAYFHSSKYISDLANGNICVALAFNGDAIQARSRAIEAKNGIVIDYTIPKEGTNLWIDMIAIPADTKTPEEAHAFINFLLDPKNIANVSLSTGYANANKAATPLMPKETLNNPAIYPTPEVIKNSFASVVLPPKVVRWMTRAWINFKSSN